jgi:tetraacyldisaccharide 4'-kinase
VVQYWEAVTAGRARGPLAAATRAGLRVISGGYWLALQSNIAVYRLGLCRQARAARPVVVIGNLTVGGTGKTTATIYLVNRLARAGIAAGVILRGHRRRAGGPAELLVSDGRELLASPLEAGDEAVLLATSLPGHPVAVGVRRERVARLLLDRTEADALVLDDGFQYFRLAREADVVLLDATQEIERDRLLPAGRLREPHHHLRRATQVWITHAELSSPERIAALRQWIGRQAPKRPVVVTEHRPTGLRPLGEGEPPAAGARVVALSGLGNPVSFEAALSRLGYEVTPARFADHHRYEPSDWERVEAIAAESGARHVVTTEKDAVKLPAPPGDRLAVSVLGCELAVVEGEATVDEIVEAVKRCLPA